MTSISYLDSVHKFALEAVAEKKINTKQAAGDEIYNAFCVQNPQVLFETIMEIIENHDRDTLAYFRDWSSRLITSHLLATHPTYASMQNLGTVNIPPVVANKTTPIKTPVKQDSPADNTRSKSKLDATEYPTLATAHCPAKKTWADETEDTERTDTQTLAARAKLMETLNWSDRVKAASMTLAEIEVMIFNKQTVEETPVKELAAPIVPDAPKKNKLVTPHLGTPKQLDFSNDVIARPVIITEPGWQPARKSKIDKVMTPATGKTSVISDEYCAKHLKTPNQKADRAGTITAAGWHFAKMAGKLPVFSDKYDWYARKLDDKGYPIGWIVLSTDAEGNPTSWKINRASQFVHTLKTTPEGKRYFIHHEICDVEAADGSWSKQSFPVSVDYLLWTLCPGQLRHKLGPCPKA